MVFGIWNLPVRLKSFRRGAWYLVFIPFKSLFAIYELGIPTDGRKAVKLL